jgi:gamma-glutamyltranspeptidase/glutathione hydrolase
MFAQRIPHFLLLCFLLLAGSSSLQAATGEKAMVVTSDPRATQAALEILRQGGNAVDSAVAAQWMLQVVAPQSSGLGGGGFFLFYDIGTRRILFFDGSVTAPAKSSPDMFLDAKGKLLPYQPDRNSGGMPAGVPGLLKLTEEVHAKYGTHKFPFAKLFEPAIRRAEEGTEVSAPLATALRENAKRLALLDPQREVFFRDGAPLEEGQKLVQPELAKTLRLIQDKGTASFYKGTIAAAMTRAVRRSVFRPGRLSGRDLEDYRIAVRDPVHATYQSYDLFSAGPPADGGVALFRALNILSHFGIPGLGQSPETYHLLGETQKVAFSNRSGVADPDLFDIPLAELLSEAWAQDRTSSIKFDQVLKSPEAPVLKQENGKKRSGSSLMIVDPHGNIAILVATLGDAFGSALRVPGHGFFLNDQLTDLAADPAAVKEPQSAELISGGQRPRGPEAPVIIFKAGKPVLLMNAYGPDDPAAVLLNMMVQKIDLGASCSGALGAPRLWVQDGILDMEPGLYNQEIIRLKLDLLGHKIEKKEKVGSAQIVCFEEGSGRMDGESDPRDAGEAAGF